MAEGGLLPPIVAELRANITEFKSKLGEAKGELTGLEEHAKSKLGGVGTAATAGFAIAGTAAIAFGASAIHAAVEGEKAHAQLALAISNTGAKMEDFEKPVEALSGKMAKLGYDNDVVEGALQKLTTATGDPTKAIADMAIVADLATAKHIDLATAAGLVAKVANGSVGVLTKMGIATKDAAGHTISASEAMKLLNEKFGGAAQANAGTMAGKMEGFHAQFSNLKETIGTKLLPILATAMSSFMGFIGWLEDHKPVLIGLALIIGGVVVGATIAWTVALFTAGGALAFLMSPVTLVVIAVAALAAGIVYAYTHFEAFRAVVDAVASFLKDTLWPILEAIGKVVIAGVIFYVKSMWLEFQILWTVAKTVFEATAAVVKWMWDNGIKPAFDAIGTGVGDVIGFFKAIPDKIGEFFGKIFDLVTAPFRAAFNFVAKIWNDTVGSLSFHIPSWVPGIGGDGFSMPKIPSFGGGGRVPGLTGAPVLAIVHGGEEIVSNEEQAGSVPRSGGRGGGGVTFHNTFNHVGSNPSEISRTLAWQQKTRRNTAA